MPRSWGFQDPRWQYLPGKSGPTRNPSKNRQCLVCFEGSDSNIHTYMHALPNHCDQVARSFADLHPGRRNGMRERMVGWQ